MVWFQQPTHHTVYRTTTLPQSTYHPYHPYHTIPTIPNPSPHLTSHHPSTNPTILKNDWDQKKILGCLGEEGRKDFMYNRRLMGGEDERRKNKIIGGPVSPMTISGLGLFFWLGGDGNGDGGERACEMIA